MLEGTIGPVVGWGLSTITRAAHERAGRAKEAEDNFRTAVLSGISDNTATLNELTARTRVLEALAGIPTPEPEPPRRASTRPRQPRPQPGPRGRLP